MSSIITDRQFPIGQQQAAGQNWSAEAAGLGGRRAWKEAGYARRRAWFLGD
jgi:hypothetical protein